MSKNTSGAGDPWLTPGRFGLLLGLFIFATFPQVLLGLKTFVVRDFGFFAYPLAWFQRECFWRGEMPLWNPYNNCGVPFLAQWNTMPLYPPVLFYLLLPLTWSLSLFCVLHLLFAGIGMYALAHRWTGSRFGASLAGLVFVFNGLTLNMLMWPSHIATLSWMPWVVLTVERAWTQGGRAFIVAALVGAMQMLAGGPETILLTWLCLVALWVAQLFAAWRELHDRPLTTSGVEHKQECNPIPTNPRTLENGPLPTNLTTAAVARAQENANERPPLPLEGGEGEKRALHRFGGSKCEWFRRILSPALSPSEGEREELAASLHHSTTPAPQLSRTPSLHPKPFTLLWRLPLLVLLVAMLSAAQLLPFLDLAVHSQREQGYADTRWSMPAHGWANFFVPMAFGRVWNMGVFFQHGQAWTSSYYLGIGVLLLIVVAVWRVRARKVWLLTALAAVGFLMSFGEHTFVYSSTRRVLPQIGLITYPIKFVTLVIFLGPLLAAFGLAHLESLPFPQKGGERMRVILVGVGLLMLIAVIVFWAWRAPMPNDNVGATIRNGLTRAVLLGVETGLLLVWFRRRLEGLRSDAGGGSPVTAPGDGRTPLLECGVPIALLLTFWCDAVTHEPPQNPTVSPDVYTPGLIRVKHHMNPQPELGQSRAMVTAGAEIKFTQFTVSNPKDNFLVKRLGYFANCNLLDDVPKVNGFFSLYPRECGELNSVIYSSTNADFPALADFMSVSQITAPGQFFQWIARSNFLPMVTAGQKPSFLDDTNALRSLLRPEFDPGKEVILSPEARSQVTVTNQTHAKVVSSKFSLDSVEMEVETQEPALVVLSQTYFHHWQARVDHQPVPLFRANYAFQALEVPGGRNRVKVRLEYQDRGLRLGLAISAISLLGCAGLWLRAFKRRQSD